MNDDRELLELAAKASGELTASWYGNDAYFDGVLSRWNPLNDDGDALRLAVKLRLTVSWDRFDDEDYATATPPHTHQGYDCMVSQDPYAATRRAITRATAAIGEGE